jgi:iron complex outermembrane receptor protein
MKKTILKMLFLLFMSSCVIVAQAQQRSVSGIVKDEQQNPLVNVSVTIPGGVSGTVSDANGNFTIVVPEGKTVLEFSLIGFSTKQVTVVNTKRLDVTMSKLEDQMEGVVVTALGISKRNKNLGYAISKVSGEEITRTNTINPITALQGKVAGVDINVVGSSGIQASPNILIRGATSPFSPGSKNRNQPIFVIDGIVIESNTTDYAEADQGSQLKNLNPDDYESITVLKGAAATSIYGSRGANGAIVITSKKGKYNSGLGIEYNSTYQVQNAYRNGMDLQNIYGMGSPSLREGNFRPDGTTSLNMASWGPKMDGSMHPAVWDQTKMESYSPQPDNWKAFNTNGKYVNNNIAISGGGEKFNFRFSYSNLYNKGQLPNNRLTRDNFDLRASGQLNKVFSMETGVSYAITHGYNVWNQSRDFFTSGQNIGFLTYYELPRNADIQAFYDNSKLADGSRRNIDPFGRLNSTFNRMDYLNQDRKENSILGNFLLKAQIAPWIDVSGKINLNFYKIFTETKEKGSGAYGAGGSYAVGGNYSSGYNAVFMAHMFKNEILKDLDFDFRFYNEMYGNGISESYGARTDGGLIVPNVFTLNNSVNPIANNANLRSYGYSTPNERVVALGGILNFNYKDYLNLELTGRNDWLSTLTYPLGVPGKNNFSVFYPSANLSYVFTDMFRSSIPQWLSFGKVRASLAWAGTGTNPYATSFGSYIQSSVADQNGTSVVTATLQNASVLPNLDLKPEIKRSLELGTNLGFLKNRINLDVAWYKTNTFNQILTIPNPPETGFSSMLINAGNIQNKGIEIELNVTPVRNKDWSWDVTMLYTRNRSKIIEFYPGIKQRQLMDSYRGSGVEVWAYEGGAFGVMTATSVRKKDPKTGLPIIRVAPNLADANADVKYSIEDYAWQYESLNGSSEEQRRTLGNIMPDFLAGFNTRLSYKNVSLYIQLDSRFGGMVFSEAYKYGMGRGSLLNSLAFRDQEHGGVQRTDSYNGQVRYDGAIPDAVFDEGQMSPLKSGTSIAGMTFREAYDKGLVAPWKSSIYHVRTYGWGGTFDDGSVSENSWIMLREINLGYQLPSNWLKPIHLKGARVSFSGRNLAYLYRTLVGGQNPESIQSNNPFMPVINGAVPFVRNFAATLNISL